MKSLRKYRTYDGATATEETLKQTSNQSVLDSARVEEYMQMDNDVRWQVLVNKVAEAKRSGEMSNQDLDAFAQSCSSALEPNQYARLLELIAHIKG